MNLFTRFAGLLGMNLLVLFNIIGGLRFTGEKIIADEPKKAQLKAYQVQKTMVVNEVAKRYEAKPTEVPKEPLKYFGLKITEEDKEILLRTAEAEAGEGNKDNKKNVMTCIINRVLSDEWPDTIKGVVFQKNQFAVIADGSYYRVKIQDSTLEAYEEWLHEGLGHDCQFFCMPTCPSAKTGWFSRKHVEFNDGLHNYYR